MVYKTLKFNSKLKTNQTSNQNSPTPFFRSRCEENVAMCSLSPVKFWPETNSICETTYFWEMIAILGKGFISCFISSNNRNLQLLSCQKLYTLLGVILNVWPWSNDYAKLSFGVHWYLKSGQMRDILTSKKSQKNLVSGAENPGWSPTRPKLVCCET